MGRAEKIYIVALPSDNFILKIQDKIKDHKPDFWEKISPKYLELSTIIIKDKTLLVRRNNHVFAQRIKLTGLIKAEIQDSGNETKLIVSYFPDTDGLKFFTWFITIISLLVFIPFMITTPSVLTVLIFSLIQLGLVVVRIIFLQECELELQNYFSRILRELTQ